MNLTESLQKVIGTCAEPYYRYKRRIERESRPPRDYSHLYRPQRVTMEERLFRLFPEGYRIVSDDETFIPDTRQLYYVMRRLLQENDCEEDLSDSYHRTVLEKYEISIGRRLCYRKAVGTMIEPHGDCPTCGEPHGCNLGTRAVEHYVVPKHRFNKILYVEKTGFMNQLLAADVHNRFDIAIAAGAGFSVQAGRELFAKIEKEIPVSVYVLHDADISGLEIARTLGKKLVHEDYAVTVVDLGLRPAEAIALGLPTESVTITAEPSWELKHSVSSAELSWLLGRDMRSAQHWKKDRKVKYHGTRCELNAFTPKEFIAWVEGKLKNLTEQPQKVIPPEEVLPKLAEELYQQRMTTLVQDSLLRVFPVEQIATRLSEALRADIPLTEAREWITSAFEEDPALSWQEAIEQKLESLRTVHGSRIDALLREEIRNILVETLRV